MRKLIIGLAIGIVLATATVAVASIPDSSGVIHGCRSTKSGALRVIDSDAGQQCARDEVALPWNQTGPQGPQGPQGPAGPPGPAGTSGVSGLHVVEANETLPAGNRGRAFDVVAYCPVGEVAVSGGYGIAFIGTLDVTGSFPWSRQNSNQVSPIDAWRVTTVVTSDLSVSLEVFASCIPTTTS